MTHSSAYPSERKPFIDWVVYYCSACGTGHVPGGASLIENYYQNAYSDTFVKDRSIAPRAYFTDQNREQHARYFARVEAQIEALQNVGARFGRVLDYGSGPGYFLYMSKPEAAYAVELDQKSHKYLDYLGATRITDADLATERFDVIVASHVVEHFTNSDVLDNMRRLIGALNLGGKLLVEVPQAGHSYLTLGARNDPHTIFFSAEGLRLLAERAGGRVVRAYARSRAVHKERADAIYHRSPDLDFEFDVGGGLTVIVEPAAAPPAQ